MKYLYLDANNQPAGPAPLDEVRQLARDGVIAADPMVCEEGRSEWKLLSSLAGGKASKLKALPVPSTILGDFVARLVKYISLWLSPRFVETSLHWARTIGHFAVFAGGALALVFAIVSAIRTNSFGVFLFGVAFVAVLAVAQFTALRFLGTADALIANTPSRVSSPAFLECVGLLAVLGSVATFLLGFVTAIKVGSAAPLVPAILSAVFWGYLGSIALHPERASVESGEGTAAEEAIGIVTFFFKAVLKLVPIFFGLLALVGSVVILVSIFAPNSRFAYALSHVLAFIPLPGMKGPGFAGAGAVLAASLLPMASYFLFLLVSLPLELWRAILSLPGKLDALRR